MQGVLRFFVLCAAALGVLVGVGLLVAAMADVKTRDAVAWTLWIGGGLTAFVAASGGSPAESYSDTCVVVGGRITDSPPLQTSPLQYALLGLLCIGAGVLVFVFS